MKFNKNISRVLAHSLIFSMCNCCVISGMEELKTFKDDQADSNTALVVYKPNPFLIENNQLVQNVNNPSCYICEAKDNPHINYVLGEDRKPLANPSENKFERCFFCNNSMHDLCWDSFSKKAVEKDEYKEKMSKDLIINILSGKTKLCPYCLYNLTKNNISKNKKEEEKTKPAKEKAEQKKEKDKGKDKEGITLTKNEAVIGGLAACAIMLAISNKGDTNITINNR